MCDTPKGAACPGPDSPCVFPGHLLSSCQHQGPGMFFLCFLELYNGGG